MRYHRTGGPDAESWDTASDDRPDLPEAVQRDVDRVAEVVAEGFRGPLWHQMASELNGYAFGRLCAVMRRTDKLMKLTEKSMTPLALTDEDRGTLYRSAPDRDRLALLTISIALETFPQLLKTGGYDPVRNRGKDGRASLLTSYFYGRCGLVFPRVFYTWRNEHTDRFLLHAPQMGDEILAHALGQTGPEPVPEDVAALCATLTAMINDLRPRDRAVWLLTVDKLSQGEIADVLGIKIGDVENARTRLRQQVRMRRRRGELYVPPSIEAEWARRRAQDNARKKAA
ncbi:sigma factor-like helix-turn-helix DNA-binding protein [Streptomyces echinatus]|uniref:sigma factor-like helix-turn-helix DNA-binding protein n=1 Tax=Streptomyces echinatus TaxID=67293 RepID=UPI0037B24B61